MTSRRAAIGFVSMLFVAGAPTGGLGDIAADRSIAVVPLARDATFDDAFKAEKVRVGLVTALKAEPQNRVAEVPPDRGGGMPEELARQLGVRYVFNGTLERDFDNVTLKWQLYDALTATALPGVMQADWDNLDVAMHLEIATQLNLTMNKPAGEEALCRAGYRRLDASLRPGGGADNAPAAARDQAYAANVKIFEQIGDRMYDVCLAILDQTFEALRLPAGYVKAAKP